MDPINVYPDPVDPTFNWAVEYQPLVSEILQPSSYKGGKINLLADFKGPGSLVIHLLSSRA